MVMDAAYNRQAARERAAARLAEGICPRCGKRPVTEGSRSCAVCRKRDNAKAAKTSKGRQQRVRAARLAAGLCPQCGKQPPQPGQSLCRKCQGYHKKYRKRRRAAGICNKCGGPLPAGLKYCRKCSAAYTVYARTKRARLRRWLLQYKLGHPCACGEAHPACLDFHHPNDDKKIGVSALVNRSLQALEAEIAKCVVLCRNCHAKAHWPETRQAQMLEEINGVV